MGVNLDLGVDKGFDEGDSVATPSTVIALERDYRLHYTIDELAVDCPYEVEWRNGETGPGYGRSGPGRYVLAGRLKEIDPEDLDDVDPGLGTTPWNKAALALLATLDPEERVYLCWG